MKTDLKSIAYAFIANGIQIFFTDYDYFIANKLCCLNCGESWFMNLTECFLCGTLNSFLFNCLDCDNLISITNSSGQCNKCNSKNIVLACQNKNCFSNTNHKLKSFINSRGGVFNKDSGMLISQQYCLNCGNDLHKYKTYKILLRNVSQHSFEKSSLHIPEIYHSSDTMLLIKFKNKDNIQYQIFKMNNLSDNIKLNDLKNSIKEIVLQLYPVKS